MTRTLLLAALLPACLGLALVQAGLGQPLSSTTVFVIRVVGFGVWFAAVLVTLWVSGQVDSSRRAPRAGVRTWLALLGLAVLVLLAIYGLGLLGAPVQAQSALAVVLVGLFVWQLGEAWGRALMGNAGIVTFGLGALGFLLAFTPLRGWAPLVAAVGGGAVLLVQGVWSAIAARPVRSLRR